MHRLCFLLLFQCVFIGKLPGQNQFNQQHEKFIRLHRSADADTLLAILQIEEKLIRQKKLIPLKQYEAKLALDRGIYFYMLFEYSKCIAPFERAEKLNGLTSDRDKILLYSYLGVSYQQVSNNFKKAHLFLDKAIDLAEKKKNYDLLASAIMKKTFIYYSQGQFAQGIRFLESFNQKKKKYLAIERRSNIHGMLAQGYHKLGNHSKSYTHFTSAIELAEKTNNVQLIADQYSGFMNYFIGKDRYREGKEWALRTISLVKDKPELEGRLNDSYAALGQIYSSLNKQDSALYYVNLSHEYALKTGDKEKLCFSYSALGNVYYDKKEYAKALVFLLKSLEYEEQMYGIKDLGVSYNNIGAAYLDMKNYPQAIAYFNKSREQAYLEGSIDALYLSYDNLSEAHRRSGNFEQVIALKDSAFLYYDSLNNIEYNRELLHLEVRYETKLKEQENKLLKLEVKRQNDLREKEQKARRFTILLGLVLVLLLSGVVYILFIKNKLRKSKVAEADAKIQNQKLEEELLVQRLNLLTEEINKKNKLIQLLESGENSALEENLINKVTLENDWLAFMSEFDKIHGGYLSELKRQFPTLTTPNLRLAALVKLEFSNKEIANIMCITENGVKKAKQRLKERIKMD